MACMQTMRASFQSPLSKQFAREIMKTRQPAHALMQLQLHWGEQQTRQRLPIGMSLLHWLAANAEGLRALEVTMVEMPPLSPLANLRHLILCGFPCRPPPFFVRKLPYLASLQTLFIRHETTHDEEEQLELDFSSLHHLRDVSLQDVVPVRLLLPTNAALHVMYDPQTRRAHRAYNPVWLTVLRHLRTFKWEPFNLGTVSRLPDVFMLPSRLTNVQMHLINEDPPSEPFCLRGAFSPCTNVLISCYDAWVDLSGGNWKHLCINARERLVLAGSDCCPLSCPDFCLEYGVIEGAVSAADAVSSGCEALPGGRECLWKGCRQSIPDFYDVACTCGACHGCLIKPGGLSQMGP